MFSAVKLARFVGAAVVVATLLGSVASGGTAPSEIKVGFVGPMTGIAAVHGENMRKAAQLAADQVNAAGGITIAGRPYRIRLVVADEEGTVAERAAAATQRLIEQDQVLAIVGYVFSSNVLAVIPIVQRDQVPTINAVGAALTIPDSIAAKKMNYVFSVSLTTDDWAVAMAGTLGHYVKPNRVAALQLNTDSARVLEKGLRANLAQTAPGAQLLFLYKEPDQTDFGAELLKIKDFKPDAIIFHHSGTPSYAFADQLYDSGLPRQAIVVGTGDYSTQEFLDRTAAKTNLQLAQVITYPAPVTPLTMPFYAAYAKVAKKVAPYQALQEYDGMLMLFEGLRRTKQLRGDLASDRAALRDALDSIDAHHPVTATRGQLYFLPMDKGHRAPAPSQVAQVQNGKLVVLWPLQAATGKFIDPRK